MQTWLNASSLHLHLGDPGSALHMAENVIRAAGKPLVATNFKDMEPLFIHFMAVAHNRILAALANLASGGQPHDNPYPHSTAAVEAWTDLMESSENMQEKEFAEVGIAMADRNLAAYNYAVGRLNEGDEAVLTFSGKDINNLDENKEPTQGSASGNERIPSETLAACDLFDSALYLLPGSAMVQGFGDDALDEQVSKDMEYAQDLPTGMYKST